MISSNSPLLAGIKARIDKKWNNSSSWTFNSNVSFFLVLALSNSLGESKAVGGAERLLRRLGLYCISSVLDSGLSLIVLRLFMILSGDLAILAMVAQLILYMVLVRVLSFAMFLLILFTASLFLFFLFGVQRVSLLERRLLLLNSAKMTC